MEQLKVIQPDQARNPLKKLSYHVITGEIHCLTGLHIGGSEGMLQIGGVEPNLMVIKHPVSKEPYIPGSSIKGKVRSELERKFGLIAANGEPTGQDNLVGRIFGPHKNPSGKGGPTRIIVRDGRRLEGGEIEYKTENVINRISGTAAHPRTLERVSAGSKFSLEIAIQVYNWDEEDKVEYNGKNGGEALIEFVKEGLRLVQQTGLGGGISRGSGGVKFEELKLDGQDFVL